MPQYRIDYVTKAGDRGVWDYEHEYSDIAAVRKTIPETLKYAKQRMPEIRRLIIVECSEKDID